MPSSDGVRRPRVDLFACVVIFVLGPLAWPWHAAETSSDTTTTTILLRQRPPVLTVQPSNTTREFPINESDVTGDSFTAPRPSKNAPSSSRPPTSPSYPPPTTIKNCDSDTSVVITSSLIPTHPNLSFLNETITSIRRHLRGLCHTAPLVITVDGLAQRDKAHNETERRRWQDYVRNLHAVYGDHTNVTVLVSERNLHLGGSLQMALTGAVRTRYVHVVQHDLPFIRPVPHRAVKEAMERYPADLRLVRFNSRPNRQRPHCVHSCWGEIRDAPYSPYHHGDGTSDDDDDVVLRFTRTPLWSDRNHLTTTSYYLHHVFPLMQRTWGHVHGFPERVMVEYGFANCSFYGTHLYGPETQPRMVQHGDGRRTGQRP